MLCSDVYYTVYNTMLCTQARQYTIPYFAVWYAGTGRPQSGDRGGVGRVLTLGRGNGQMLEVAILQTKWYLTWILAFGRFLGGVGNSSIHTHHLVRGGCQVACQEVLYVHLQPTH